MVFVIGLLVIMSLVMLKFLVTPNFTTFQPHNISTLYQSNLTVQIKDFKPYFTH